MIFKRLEQEQVKEFKELMIAAFQYGYESYTKKKEEQVLPEEDIDKSLYNKNSHAYVMVDDDNKILGGLIVNINTDTNINYLDFIFVRVDSESKGIGQKMWKEVEKLYPATLKWQTCTPYFDQRNIHFYVNKLGFKIVEYYNSHHKDPNEPVQENDEFFEEDGGMFEFEKVMK